MSSKRSANRFRLMVLLAFATVLALGSSWLLLVTKKHLADATPEQRTEPDYIVHNFSYVRMTPEGQARYHVTGDTLIHRPADDSYLVHRPVVVNISSRGERQTMTSDTAVIEDENRKIHMFGNVEADRPAFGTNEAQHLSTEYLLILPDEDVTQTPKEVTITRGTTKLTGIGMYANNLTREFRIYEQTRVFMAPPDKPGR